MRRREFITLLGGAVIWPSMAEGQQLEGKLPRVVQLSPADNPSQANGTRRLLRELGYVEGRNIRIEFRDAGGNVDTLRTLAEDVVREGGVDAIIAVSTPAALAAHKATQTIPIVALVAVDPVASGLADSLSHPGRNVTGIAVFSEETTTKRVELMREILPLAVRLGTVTTKLSSGPQSLAPVLETGRKLGFTVQPIHVDDPANLATDLSTEVLSGFDALVFVPDAIVSAHMAEVIRLVGLAGKPAIFPSPDWVANGGFMSFGPDFADASRHLVLQLDRVLKGTKPSDLPFERPTKFDLRINLRIAKALGIELSPMVLIRADQVIE